MDLNDIGDVSDEELGLEGGSVHRACWGVLLVAYTSSFSCKSICSNVQHAPRILHELSDKNKVHNYSYFLGAGHNCKTATKR